MSAHKGEGDTEGVLHAPGPAHLRAGDVLAGRFRVERFLAQGGMGEVYEAYDLELRESVALKTLRGEAADATGVERFRRETALARRVTHGSVCRTFDVFHHRFPHASSDLVFLTMELLRGDTLAEILKRGPLSLPEARDILAQVVEALAAAHAQGVVHRDFKPGNVVLERRADGSLRAVVTDFGLARTLAGADGDSSQSGHGMMGTPAYMAPEQVRGSPVTPATDVYALGLVLFEMVTGRRPFEADTPLGVALARLSGDPVRPRKVRPDLPAPWEAAILGCLEREPADRFARVQDVLHAVAGEKVAAGRPRRWAPMAAGLVILLIGGAGLLAVGRAPRPGADPGPRRVVAVLGFRDLAPRTDSAALAPALGEMLAMELASGRGLRLVPGENVARARVELALANVDTLSGETLGRIRAHLGSDLVVRGSFFASGPEAGGRLRLDVQVQDATSGELVASITETGTQSAFLDVVARVGVRLREALGGSVPEAGGGGALPRNPQAARLYADGLDRLRGFDALAAREQLERAVAAEPDYPLTHSALASAWSALGYDTRARDEARRAFELGHTLPREQLLLVEGRHREASREWDRAIEAYRALWQSFPDNLEYGLALAQAQTASGHSQEALATVSALRLLPDPFGSDPRVDLAEAAAGLIGDIDRALVAAGRAATRGNAIGAPLLVAQARLLQGSALRKKVRIGEALVACEEARRLFAAAGDRGGSARALAQIASAAWWRGDPEHARTAAAESLAISRQIGDQTGVARALNTLAGLASDQGRIGEGLRTYEEVLGITREVGDGDRELMALTNTAIALIETLEIARARERLEAAVEGARRAGNDRRLAFALFHLGSVRQLQGDLKEARALLEEAEALARTTGQPTFLADVQIGITTLEFQTGRVEGAQDRIRAALDVKISAGERIFAVFELLGAAELSLEEGRAEDGERVARELIGEFEKMRAHRLTALASTVLADALLVQGRVAEALRGVETARALPLDPDSRRVHVRIDLVEARVRAALGQRERARSLADRVIANGRRAGVPEIHIQARLLRETLDRESPPAERRARLQALEDEATRIGLVILARRIHRQREALGT